MLDPASWDDSNDRRFLDLYKEKKKLATVLALCFAQADETYHHWRIFAPGSGGVCIRFDKTKLLKAFAKTIGIRGKTVRYLTLEEIRAKQIKTGDLPFLKRYAFQNEREYRIIYESRTQALPSLNIPISLACIQRITLSPWMPFVLSSNVKTLLKKIDRCSIIEVVRSTLISNQEWKSHGEAAAS